MTDAQKRQLVALADRYETASFCNDDPSQFLRWYEASRVADIECAGFVAAMLSFGSRTQFIPKIRRILQCADSSSGSITAWLKTGMYQSTFAHGAQKFYRFYSYDDMQTFFCELAAILHKADSLGDFLKEKYIASGASPCELISAAFPASKIVPKGKNCANKRLHMFLRWMVRRNSAVDVGLWTWVSPAELLIPLDVHVLQEAIRLKLLAPNASASRKSAELLTAAMNEVFPGDPARADFALFGLGVDKNPSSL